jgi:hypothetical protein
LPVIALLRLPLLVSALTLALLNLQVPTAAALMAPLRSRRLDSRYQQHDNHREKKFHKPGSMQVHVTTPHPLL